MIEYNSLTVAFQVDLYTVCDRFTPDSRMLSHIGHSQIDKDDFKLLFGRNTDVANDYYQTLHEINHSCLYDSIKQALKQNFELLLINCNRGDEPVYKFADSMNNLVLCGKDPYVIAVETPEAFVEALHDVNDNHAKDDVESALDYISDAKCEFVKELKY